ncbi:MAG: VacJ family lipoprotein [Alphaproteobacteria bacterium]|nr:VacJ family lipoprotein [Alphaproteobacteria bacterium]
MAAAVLVLGLAGCATPPDDPEARAAFQETNDPIEPVNRAIFEFNLFVDKTILRPVAQVYELVLPDLVRDGVRNFLRHLKTPVILANDLMQGEMERAGTTMGRFIFNTVAGIGFFDPAGEAGHPYHPEDFGQTLAVWGVGDGPYLMLPFLGPSNLRDAGGFVADRYLNPLTYWADNSERWVIENNAIILGVTEAVDMRSRNYRQLQDLEETSLDFYATVRSLYRQTRQSLIENRDPGSDETSPVPSMSLDELDYEFYATDDELVASQAVPAE